MAKCNCGRIACDECRPKLSWLVTLCDDPKAKEVSWAGAWVIPRGWFNSIISLVTRNTGSSPVPGALRDEK